MIFISDSELRNRIKAESFPKDDCPDLYFKCDNTCEGKNCKECWKIKGTRYLRSK